MYVATVSQTDPAKTVQIFIDLIQRHEQSFYSFVHKVHTKGEGLFTRLMRWIELFLTLMRDGLGEPISLDFILPHTGAERADILREVDEVALYHYKLKVAYEAKLRRRFGRTQGMNDADAEDEAAAQLVNGVVRDLSFGDLVKGDADDLAAQETDDEDDSSDEDSSSGSGSSGSGSGSDESDEDSEDSGGGSDTERDSTPHTGEIALPLGRSRTVGHSPVEQRQPPPHLRSPHGVRHSADTPRPRPHTPEERPPGVPQRSRTFSTPSRPMHSDSRFKDLPPHPGSKELPPVPHSAPNRARQQEKQPERPLPPSKKAAPKPKKGAAAPKPPDLAHIPQLLPLFVEMVRASVCPVRPGADGIRNPIDEAATHSATVSSLDALRSGCVEHTESRRSLGLL